MLDFPTLTIEDRDAVARTLNWPEEWAQGCLAHAAGAANGGLRVIELWESRAHWDRFFEQRLQAAIGEALGDRARPPQITQTELARLDLAPDAGPAQRG